MKIICPKHGEFFQTPKSHLLHDCVKCSYEKRGKMFRHSTEKFIEKAIGIHGDKYDYSKVEYIKAKTKVCIICPEHGEFLQEPNYHLNGEGCPFCNESHLERIVKQYLEKNGLNYIFQYKPSYLGKQSLDFYLPDYCIGIECQGKQHFGFGGWSKNFDFDKLHQLDIKKNTLCKENGMKIVYVIPNNIKIKNKHKILYKNNFYFVKDLEKILLDYD